MASIRGGAMSLGRKVAEMKGHSVQPASPPELPADQAKVDVSPPPTKATGRTVEVKVNRPGASEPTFRSIRVAGTEGDVSDE